MNFLSVSRFLSKNRFHLIRNGAALFLSLVIFGSFAQAANPATTGGNAPPAQQHQLPPDSPIQDPRRIIENFHNKFGAKVHLAIFVKGDFSTESKDEKPLSEYDLSMVQNLFSQPFLEAGAQLVRANGNVDMGDPTKPTAPTRSADIFIEIVARRHEMKVATLGGDAPSSRLDLIVTAYDLRQSGLVLGEMSSEMLFGFDQPRGIKRPVSDIEMIDQTALALMDHMTR